MRKIIGVLLCLTIVAGLVFSDEDEIDEFNEVRELLAAEPDGFIRYLYKVNFGFEGGDNWLAVRASGNHDSLYMYIYIVGNDKKVKFEKLIGVPELSKVNYWDSNTRSYVDLEYDLMRDIPGTRIGNTAANFGDYNGDGLDEIFVFSRAVEDNCYIWGKDTSPYGERGKFYSVCRFDFISPKEPSPVVFASYQGTDGILVYYRNHLAERYVYGFFVWDEVTHEYEEDMELLADEVARSMFTTWNGGGNKNVNKLTEEEKNPQSVIDTENQTKAVVETNAEKNSMPLWALIAIIGVFVAVSACTALFVVKRRK
jgi:hypothetical protein